MTSPDKPLIVVKRLVIMNAADQFLLVRRSQSDAYNPSLWEFPGGKLEKGQTLDQAGIEETKQETGLLVTQISHLLIGESSIISHGRYQDATYVALFGIARTVGGRLSLSEEHEDSVWTAYEEALGYDLTPQSRKALMGFGSAVLKTANSQFA